MTDPGDQELISAVPVGMRDANGIPSVEQCKLRRTTFERVRSFLAADVLEESVRVSPLGPEWSHDVDVHAPSNISRARLADAGWLRMTTLLARVGIPGEERWAVMEAGEVIGACDIRRAPPPDPVQNVLNRCADRGSVRVREVLELRALLRSGKDLPNNHIVRVAAGIEAGLGGDLLRCWKREGPPVGPPPIRLSRRTRARAGALRAAFRPRVIVAVSGVDGAGKSSLCRTLSIQLARAGVPCGVVWARPGASGPDWIGALAQTAKRILKQDPAPGVHAVAAGSASNLRSRTGVLGWTWTLIVTISFLYDVRAQLRRARGVVFFDRHLLDALATLEFVYRGVNLRVARAAIRHVLPGADVTIYLDVPADVAVRRKPDDVMGRHAVDEQLNAYTAQLESRSDIELLDGQLPTSEIAGRVLRLLSDRFDERGLHSAGSGLGTASARHRTGKLGALFRARLPGRVASDPSRGERSRMYRSLRYER